MIRALNFSKRILPVLLSLAAASLLATYSGLYGGPSHIVGYSIFGASLVLFYSSRTLYLWATHDHPSKEKLRVMDLSMIYVLVASTYTPIALILPDRVWGWSIFGIIWFVSLLAVFLTAFTRITDRLTGSFVYLTLTILDIAAFSVVHEFLNNGAVFWFSIGAVFYLVSNVFVIFRPKTVLLTYFKKQEILALYCVIIGSFCHFWAIFHHMLYI